MIMEKMETPKYVQDAAFIELERDINPEWWPRDPAYYTNTKNWKERVSDLASAIHPEHAVALVEHGEPYPAAKGNVAFVSDENGVATYAVVAAELQQRNGEYPTSPTMADYWFKKVTYWAYVFDREKALDSSVWSREDLRVINSVCG